MTLSLGQERLIRKIGEQLQKDLFFFLQHARRQESSEHALNKILRHETANQSVDPIHRSQ